MNCEYCCLLENEREAYWLHRGYHITLLKDATAGFTIEQKKVATELIWPLFAHEVKTVAEWKASLA